MNLGYFAATHFGDPYCDSLGMDTDASGNCVPSGTSILGSNPNDPSYCASLGMQADGSGNCIPGSNASNPASGCPPGTTWDPSQGACVVKSGAGTGLTQNPISGNVSGIPNPSTQPAGGFWSSLGQAAGGLASGVLGVLTGKKGSAPSEPPWGLLAVGALAVGGAYLYLRKPRAA